MATICNIDNNKFDDAEWSRITEVCRKKKHIGQDENVKEIIENDDKRMEQYGITYEQLEKYFDKIMKHYGNNRKMRINDDDKLMINKVMKGIDTGGWCLWLAEKAKIFNGRITVVRLTWGGAEQCPFQDIKDKKYYGYEYGSHDWIFIKDVDVMHIGDLLFHQIVRHHFFQSPQSRFHVDIDKLIKFFDIKKDVDYTTTTKKCKIITREEDIKEEAFMKFDKTQMRHDVYETNEIYYDDKNIILCINDINTLPERVNLSGYENELCMVLSYYKRPQAGVDKKTIKLFELGNTKVLDDDELTKNW